MKIITNSNRKINVYFILNLNILFIIYIKYNINNKKYLYPNY